MSTSDGRLAGCTREWCAKRAEEEHGGASEYYAKGGFDWQHCGVAGCHEFYWRGRDSADCATCGARSCWSCWRIAREHRRPVRGTWRCFKCWPYR